eukprot:gene28316-31428_t
MGTACRKHNSTKHYGHPFRKPHSTKHYGTLVESTQHKALWFPCRKHTAESTMFLACPLEDCWLRECHGYEYAAETRTCVGSNSVLACPPEDCWMRGCNGYEYAKVGLAPCDLSTAMAKAEVGETLRVRFVVYGDAWPPEAESVERLLVVVGGCSALETYLCNGVCSVVSEYHVMRSLLPLTKIISPTTKPPTIVLLYKEVLETMGAPWPKRYGRIFVPLDSPTSAQARTSNGATSRHLQDLRTGQAHAASRNHHDMSIGQGPVLGAHLQDLSTGQAHAASRHLHDLSNRQGSVLGTHLQDLSPGQAQAPSRNLHDLSNGQGPVLGAHLQDLSTVQAQAASRNLQDLSTGEAQAASRNLQDLSTGEAQAASRKLQDLSTGEAQAASRKLQDLSTGEAQAASRHLQDLSTGEAQAASRHLQDLSTGQAQAASRHLQDLSTGQAQAASRHLQDLSTGQAQAASRHLQDLSTGQAQAASRHLQDLSTGQAQAASRHLQDLSLGQGSGPGAHIADFSTGKGSGLGENLGDLSTGLAQAASRHLHDLSLGQGSGPGAHITDFSAGKGSGLGEHLGDLSTEQAKAASRQHQDLRIGQGSGPGAYIQELKLGQDSGPGVSIEDLRIGQGLGPGENLEDLRIGEGSGPGASIQDLKFGQNSGPGAKIEDLRIGQGSGSGANIEDLRIRQGSEPGANIGGLRIGHGSGIGANIQDLRVGQGSEPGAYIQDLKLGQGSGLGANIEGLRIGQGSGPGASIQDLKLGQDSGLGAKIEGLRIGQGSGSGANIEGLHTGHGSGIGAKIEDLRIRQGSGPRVHLQDLSTGGEQAASVHLQDLNTGQGSEPNAHLHGISTMRSPGLKARERRMLQGRGTVGYPEGLVTELDGTTIYAAYGQPLPVALSRCTSSELQPGGTCGVSAVDSDGDDISASLMAPAVKAFVDPLSPIDPDTFIPSCDPLSGRIEVELWVQVSQACGSSNGPAGSGAASVPSLQQLQDTLPSDQSFLEDLVFGVLPTLGLDSLSVRWGQLEAVSVESVPADTTTCLVNASLVLEMGCVPQISTSSDTVIEHCPCPVLSVATPNPKAPSSGSKPTRVSVASPCKSTTPQVDKQELLNSEVTALLLNSGILNPQVNLFLDSLKNSIGALDDYAEQFADLLAYQRLVAAAVREESRQATLVCSQLGVSCEGSDNQFDFSFLGDQLGGGIPTSFTAVLTSLFQGDSEASSCSQQRQPQARFLFTIGSLDGSASIPKGSNLGGLLAEDIPPRRVVGVTNNQVIGGLFLHQTRRSMGSSADFASDPWGSCSGSAQFAKAYTTACQLEVPALGDGLEEGMVRGRGVDPTMQPKSSIFYKGAYDQPEQWYNTTAPNPLVSDKGTVWGFEMIPLQGLPDGFPFAMTVSVKEGRLKQMMAYLEDGRYLDTKDTSSLKAQVATFNPELRAYGLFQAVWSWGTNGAITARFDVVALAYHSFKLEAGSKQAFVCDFLLILTTAVFSMLWLLEASPLLAIWWRLAMLKLMPVPRTVTNSGGRNSSASTGGDRKSKGRALSGWGNIPPRKTNALDPRKDAATNRTDIEGSTSIRDSGTKGSTKGSTSIRDSGTKGSTKGSTSIREPGTKGSSAQATCMDMTEGSCPVVSFPGDAPSHLMAPHQHKPPPPPPSPAHLHQPHGNSIHVFKDARPRSSSTRFGQAIAEGVKSDVILPFSRSLGRQGSAASRGQAVAEGVESDDILPFSRSLGRQGSAASSEHGVAEGVESDDILPFSRSLGRQGSAASSKHGVAEGDESDVILPFSRSLARQGSAASSGRTVADGRESEVKPGSSFRSLFGMMSRGRKVSSATRQHTVADGRESQAKASGSTRSLFGMMSLGRQVSSATREHTVADGGESEVKPGSSTRSLFGMMSRGRQVSVATRQHTVADGGESEVKPGSSTRSLFGMISRGRQVSSATHQHTVADEGESEAKPSGLSHSLVGMMSHGRQASVASLKHQDVHIRLYDEGRPYGLAQTLDAMRRKTSDGSKLSHTNTSQAEGSPLSRDKALTTSESEPDDTVKTIRLSQTLEDMTKEDMTRKTRDLSNKLSPSNASLGASSPHRRDKAFSNASQGEGSHLNRGKALSDPDQGASSPHSRDKALSDPNQGQGSYLNRDKDLTYSEGEPDFGPNLSVEGSKVVWFIYDACIVLFMAAALAMLFLYQANLNSENLPREGTFDVYDADQHAPSHYLMLKRKLIYTLLQCIILLLMLIRIISLLVFYPTLAIIPFTLIQACPDLLHLAIALMVVVVMYAMLLTTCMGNSVEVFSDLDQSMYLTTSSIVGLDQSMYLTTSSIVGLDKSMYLTTSSIVVGGALDLFQGCYQYLQQTSSTAAMFTVPPVAYAGSLFLIVIANSFILAILSMVFKVLKAVAMAQRTLGDDCEPHLHLGKKSLSFSTSRRTPINQTVARSEGRGLAHPGQGEPTEPMLGTLASFGSKAQLLRTLSTKLMDQSPGHNLPRIYTSLASRLSAQSCGLSLSRKHISMSFQKSIEARLVTSGAAGSDPAQPPESKRSSKVWGRVRHAYQMAPHFGAGSKSITIGRSKKLNTLSTSNFELPLLQADLESSSRSAVTPIHPFLLMTMDDGEGTVDSEILESNYLSSPDGSHSDQSLSQGPGYGSPRLKARLQEDDSVSVHPNSAPRFELPNPSPSSRTILGRVAGVDQGSGFIRAETPRPGNGSSPSFPRGGPILLPPPPAGNASNLELALGRLAARKTQDLVSHARRSGSHLSRSPRGSQVVPSPDSNCSSPLPPVPTWSVAVPAQHLRPSTSLPSTTSAPSRLSMQTVPEEPGPIEEPRMSEMHKDEMHDIAGASSHIKKALVRQVSQSLHGAVPAPAEARQESFGTDRGANAFTNASETSSPRSQSSSGRTQGSFGADTGSSRRRIFCKKPSQDLATLGSHPSLNYTMSARLPSAFRASLPGESDPWAMPSRAQSMAVRFSRNLRLARQGAASSSLNPDSGQQSTTDNSRQSTARAAALAHVPLAVQGGSSSLRSVTFNPDGRQPTATNNSRQQPTATDNRLQPTATDNSRQPTGPLAAQGGDALPTSLRTVGRRLPRRGYSSLGQLTPDAVSTSLDTHQRGSSSQQYLGMMDDELPVQFLNYSPKSSMAARSPRGQATPAHLSDNFDLATRNSTARGFSRPGSPRISRMQACSPNNSSPLSKLDQGMCQPVSNLYQGMSQPVSNLDQGLVQSAPWRTSSLASPGLASPPPEVYLDSPQDLMIDVQALDPDGRWQTIKAARTDHRPPTHVLAGMPTRTLPELPGTHTQHAHVRTDRATRNSRRMSKLSDITQDKEYKDFLELPNSAHAPVRGARPARAPRNARRMSQSTDITEVKDYKDFLELPNSAHAPVTGARTARGTRNARRMSQLTDITQAKDYKDFLELPKSARARTPTPACSSVEHLTVSATELMLDLQCARRWSRMLSLQSWALPSWPRRTMSTVASRGSCLPATTGRVLLPFGRMLKTTFSEVVGVGLSWTTHRHWGSP